MGNNTCPTCGRPIAADDLNIREGVGLCRACGVVSRLAEIADAPTVDPQATAHPPAGCAYDASFAGTTVARASLVSIPGALGALAVCLFWNGILSIFLCVVAASVYRHVVGPVPHWVPAPGSAKGSDGSPMSVGMTIFMGLFISPHTVIGVGMIVNVLLNLFGRVEVEVTGTDGRVRTGVGPFCWTRRFDASRVTRVREGLTKWQENGRSKELIEIEAGDRVVRFGSLLRPERREWMRSALHAMLVAGPRKGGRGERGGVPLSHR